MCVSLDPYNRTMSSAHDNAAAGAVEIVHARTAQELENAIAELATADFIALDTEFMRESTYYPKLCLIQAATRRFCVLIDVLALDSLAPFLAFLREPSRVKVLHAARQDLEVMSLASGTDISIPAPVFDTQVAAGLLGYPAQVGYGDLVAKRLGHVLAKGHARTDWSHRPLSPEQLEYAADDVRFLVPLYLDLRAALLAAGRLQWLEEDAQALSNPDLYRTAPEAAWQRLKGLAQLPPIARSITKALATWREQRAIQADKPRGWILSDDALRTLADRAPTAVEELEQIRALPNGTIKKRGIELLELIERAKADAVNEAAALKPVRPDARQLALVTKLMNFVRAEGERQQISPELLATRRDVEQLVFNHKAASLMQGWRKEVIGEQLVKMAGVKTREAF